MKANLNKAMFTRIGEAITELSKIELDLIYDHCEGLGMENILETLDEWYILTMSELAEYTSKEWNTIDELMDSVREENAMSVISFDGGCLCLDGN